MSVNKIFRAITQPASLSIVAFKRGDQMKRVLSAAAFLLAALNAPAQPGGTVNFGNHSSSIVTNGQSGHPVMTNDHVRAALYWAPLGSAKFAQLGATATVGAPLPGLFVGGTRTTGPETPGGSSAAFQVRAWSGDYATYEEALLQRGVLIGQSAVVTNQTGDPWGSPPAPPLSLLAGGLSGFTLTTNRGPVSAPTIACAADKTVQCGDAWTFDAPAAVDGCSGAGLPAYVLSIVTNGRCPQVITQTWAVTNSCDTQYVTCSQQVTIVNLTPPVLTCAPNKVASFGSTWAFDLPIASDPCAGGSLPVTVLGTVSNNLGSSIQLFTRTWLATNTCNNNFTAGSQTVTVTCSNCPVWAVIANAYGLAGDLDGDGLVDQTEINAVLANYWASNPGLYMTNPISLGGGFFQFALTNFTGWNFTMLASTNLVDWASLPGPAYPVYQFYDAEAASNAPVRVYRLRWP